MDMEPLFRFAFENAGDATHGRDHILRVRKNALDIARSFPEADLQALEAAAILHDCGQREQLQDPAVDHACAGAQKADKLLTALGWDKDTRLIAVRAIRAHSNPLLAREAGIEASILFDADKLEMLGAVGLARALIWSNNAGYALIDAQGESFYSVALGDTRFASENLITPRARHLARERAALSQKYLEALLSETTLDEPSCPRQTQ